MIRCLSLALIVTSLLAGSALAAGDREQADENYIAAKQSCENMSTFEKSVCFQKAEEAHKQALQSQDNK